MLEENKTPLTLAVMARAEELAPNVGDQYDTDRLIRITNVSGSVFRRYELHRLGVHAPIASFGDTSTKKDRNWWLASQLLELDTKGLENPKAGEENAATEANDLQTQIEAIKKQHPHCDIEARVDPDGKLRILSVKGREGASTSHDDTTVVTIVNCDPPAEAAKECPVAKETQPTQEQLKAIFEHVTKLTAEQAKNLGFQYSLTARTNFPRIELQIVSFSKYGNNKDEWKCTIIHQSPTDPLHEQYSFQSTYDFETTCHRLWWPTVNFEEERAKDQVASQEELKRLFEHLENLPHDSEVSTRLTVERSLIEEANGRHDSFSFTPNLPKFNWEILVTKSPTGKYYCRTPFDFDHTCRLLGYKKVEASQQEFISIPVTEFQELQSQVKELMDWRNGMTKLEGDSMLEKFGKALRESRKAERVDPAITYYEREVIAQHQKGRGTEEQIKQLLTYVLDLGRKGAKEKGFVYDPSYVNNEFLTEVKSLREEWGIDFIKMGERYFLVSPFDFAQTCEMLGFAPKV